LGAPTGGLLDALVQLLDGDETGEPPACPDEDFHSHERTLRGNRLHSTLAVEHGVTAHVVAASLGHESSTTTIRSCVKPEEAPGAPQRRVMTVLEGTCTTYDSAPLTRSRVDSGI
jgi:hypothetical protein